jgi:hypothetical protein
MAKFRDQLKALLIKEFDKTAEEVDALIERSTRISSGTAYRAGAPPSTTPRWRLSPKRTGRADGGEGSD